MFWAHSIPTLLADSSSGSRSGLNIAVLLFAATALSLLVVLVVAIMLILNRRRSQRSPTSPVPGPRDPGPDAWSEAAKRIQPYEQEPLPPDREGES